MHRFTAILLVAFGAAGVASGAEPASGYARLKPIEWLVGEWSGQYTATFDLGGIKKGARVTAVASCRWVLDKGMMVSDFADEVDGKKVLTSFEMLGLEGGAKRPVHWIFGPLGNGKGEWLDVGPKAVLRWNVNLAEGKLEGTSYLEKKNADTYTWQARGVTLAGKKLPDFPVVTYARKKSAPGVPAPVASGGLQIRDLAWIVGDWEGEYTMPAGFSSLAAAGAKVLTHNTFSWTLDEKFIMLKIHDQIDGKTISTGSEILGKEPMTGRLGHWFFGSNGGCGDGDWFRRGNAWVLSWRAFDPEGKYYRGESEHIHVDANTFTWQMKNLSENGKSIPDWPKVTYRRKKAAPGDLLKASPTTFQEFQEYGKLLVGEWQGEFILAGDVPGLGKNGQKVNGQGTVAWACGQKGLEVNYQFGSAKGKSVSCWDAQSQRIKEMSFDSTGGVYKGEAFKRNGKWVAAGTTAYPDGAKRLTIDTLTVAPDGKTHFHDGEVYLNDVKQPGYRDVWKRVK